MGQTLVVILGVLRIELKSKKKSMTPAAEVASTGIGARMIRIITSIMMMIIIEIRRIKSIIMIINIIISINDKNTKMPWQGIFIKKRRGGAIKKCLGN